MENASKALMMAGAVLVTIILISMVMFYFNKVKDISSAASAHSYNEQVEAFNRFFVYSKPDLGAKVYGSDAYNIIGKAIDINSNEWSLGKIEIEFLGSNYTNYSQEQIKTRFYKNDKAIMDDKFAYNYTINASNGLVNKITFTN